MSNTKIRTAKLLNYGLHLLPSWLKLARGTLGRLIKAGRDDFPEWLRGWTGRKGGWRNRFLAGREDDTGLRGVYYADR